MPAHDVRDVLRALPNRFPPGDGYLESDIFTVRHRILRELDPQPTSVFEFGALMGYFLVTALDACPSIERVGWVDNETHTVGSNRACCDNVLHTRRDLAAMTFARSWGSITDGLQLLWDVVSVDGDHTYDGCRIDLEQADALSPRLIFVDDWNADTHRDDIQRATHEFLEAHGSSRFDLVPSYELVEEIATQNGLAVIRRKR